MGAVLIPSIKMLVTSLLEMKEPQVLPLPNLLSLVVQWPETTLPVTTLHFVPMSPSVISHPFFLPSSTTAKVLLPEAETLFLSLAAVVVWPSPKMDVSCRKIPVRPVWMFLLMSTELPRVQETWRLPEELLSPPCSLL